MSESRFRGVLVISPRGENRTSTGTLCCADGNKLWINAIASASMSSTSD
ncbi:MAG TPA: hypothetical protein V6D50_05070 [Chroococcales cyanobacterium]